MPSDNFTVLLSFVRKGKIHYLILTKWKNLHYTALWQWLCVVVGVPGLLLEDFSSEKDLRGEKDSPVMKELVRHAGTTGIRFLNLRVEGSPLNSVS